MESIWNLTQEMPSFPQLKKDLKADVLIVGGGITGILCAFMLQKRGVGCVVVEAGRICGGVTQNTTAKITLQHGLLYNKIIDKYGLEKAKGYFLAQNEALESYRQLCREIDCGFEIRDSFVYSCDSRREIEEEANALRKIGCPAVVKEQLELPFETRGAVCIANQAQINPLKLLSALVQDLRIYENTRVLNWKAGEVTTDRGKIRAEKVIIATHFPFLDRYGAYFLKMYQHRSYVLALKNVPAMKGMYVDASNKGLSFRSYQGLLLLGGGGHRTGKNGGNWQELSRFAEKYYPQAEEVCRWATQDCITLDGIPYIGQYAKNAPSLYVATGYNKWGMTSSMVAATLLADMVEGRQNAYAQVFAPDRGLLHPQLLINGFETAKNLLTPTAPRCPHLGCALKYNPQEHSWDCACHGSRFSKDGTVLNNPANTPLTRKIKFSD